MILSRISHTEVEHCLAKPQQWLAERLAPPATGRKIGYNQTLMTAIYYFHKVGNRSSARKRLEELLVKRDFRDASRAAGLLKHLESYMKWFDNSDAASADSKIRIIHKVGFFELRGEISRIDVLQEGGYRAVLLCEPRPDWQEELRMPLIQSAIAVKYGIPVSEVLVGIQAFDGSGLQTRKYSRLALADANSKFRRLGIKVEKMIKP